MYRAVKPATVALLGILVLGALAIGVANQRMLPQPYPYGIGHDFSGGYRARRIAERLQKMQHISERDMLQLQLDTQTKASISTWDSSKTGRLRPDQLEELVKRIAGEKPS